MSTSSMPPVVTSSLDEEIYDFDADLAATLDAQDALRALEPQDEDQGGQEDWGVYQDDDEYNNDGDDDESRRVAPERDIENFVRHTGAYVSTMGYDEVSFEGASPNIDVPPR